MREILIEEAIALGNQNSTDGIQCSRFVGRRVTQTKQQDLSVVQMTEYRLHVLQDLQVVIQASSVSGRCDFD